MSLPNRALAPWLSLLIGALLAFATPHIARAHFSYSDPRIIHVTETRGELAVLMRLPAPLALLPDDWQGRAETGLPPFAFAMGDEALIDPNALDLADPGVQAALSRLLMLEIDGRAVTPEIRAIRLHDDDARPRFGTLKTARSALAAPAGTGPVPYFDATLDLLLMAPGGLDSDLRLASDLGARFAVMDRFGTVLKLYRAEVTETQAVLGPFDVHFAAATTRVAQLTQTALSGAEHIYNGADHLALILLIALAARGWRQALGWASAFTLGHVATLAAGLYGVAPQASWFIPLVELAIALSIVVTGIAIFARKPADFGPVALLIVGLIHGYGFAASASTATFAGDFDASNLVAFALGLEICQFALYALLLPIVRVLDHALPTRTSAWRRGMALGVALLALSETWARMGLATSAFA
ncbi:MULTISPECIES: HupE/UreJ family protein [Marinovum]|uniref:HupE/UreJ family protein n=1 Tax=Marinovum TaxID=367771 RepID=UPI00237C16A2|nr:HupE/UreJ family protein [Marinovum sp. PR37]MDD9745279.1 HupE/UreJ family protein [Marinovum sp. PR37]